ncbi:FAD-binding oxidoreductase [Eilatimonas milleporae]|uniref:4-phosphoerythronate dehydrogenase (FAD-dependent) n=1 Tax=Eilatimonas milleporae TaxID=911205 RepID=A0A3M0CFN8_9PROT|nr:FAD-binding oxidoreductase [Eilatimonas milleporae]RMB08394.1 4-phosphoerythronate dehydrogenase (FAD-dependent) [Eilatimonas milleporae]
MTALSEHLAALRALVGEDSVTDDPARIAPHMADWRGRYTGSTDIMLMPGDTDALSRAVRYCHDHGLPVVPQGGNTGLVAGGLPGLNGRREILVSLKRMTSVIHVDADDHSLLAEAGCTIAAVQDAAEKAGRMFPLSLASEGSCTVGGTIATNAGGVHVIRYGTMRRLVLGVEAVLADGKIFEDLSPLRKDNRGYDLKQLLIGSEGTLGIITKATLQLSPAEKSRATAFIAVRDPGAALELLSLARDHGGDRVSVFELICETGLEMVLTHIPGTRRPFEHISPWYVLLELGGAEARSGLTGPLEKLLENALEAGLAQDASIAQSNRQRSEFWRLRESLSEAQSKEGASVKHDISVPVGKVPAFLTVATPALEAAFPGIRVTPFGHMGDGNLHFNVMQPKGAEKGDFLALWDGMNRMVHDFVTDHGGSISAEHGIGTIKRGELARLSTPARLETQRAIKKALDPKGILNPGALFN